MGDEITTPNLPANTHNTAVAPGGPIAPLAIYIAVFFIVWALRATVFIHIDESIESAGWKNVYSNALKFIIWVVPVFITLRQWGLQPLNYTKLTTRVDKRGFLAGVIVVVVWLSLVVVGESVLTHRNAGAMLLQRSSDWLSILIGVFFSPIWEEILFRGFFLNRLNERLSFWSANVISALLFMLIHWPYWVSKKRILCRRNKGLIQRFSARLPLRVVDEKEQFALARDRSAHRKQFFIGVDSRIAL